MTTFWGYISNGLQDAGQLAYTAGRESRSRGRKGGDRQKDRFMSTGQSREPRGKVCYEGSQPLLPRPGPFMAHRRSLPVPARSLRRPHPPGLQS